eukprot:6758962-Pyramimonas_sp.AAC.1
MPDQLQALLAEIARAGARLAMELHWNKFQLMPVRCDINLCTPSGDHIRPRDSTVCLEAALSSSGQLSA